MNSTPQTGSCQYVSFKLGKETYALDIWHAREIVDAPSFSQLPNAPDWVCGLMNLRGHILPVIDLRTKFGFDAAAASLKRYVIIVDVPGNGGEQLTVGVLADAVLEVFDLAASELGAPPKFGARFSRSYLLGMATREGELVAVMDAPKVLADTDELLEELAEVDAQAADVC